MKQLVTISAVFGFLLAPQAGAQNCSAWDNWSVRGTYTAQGAGSIDLAKEVNSTLPKGYSPQAFVQGFVFDGQGGGTGWIVSNLGGIDFQAKVKWTYSVQADCRIVATHSFYINGNWSPPNKLVMVISGQNDRLKLKGIMAGAGPGFSVAQATALRLSMDYF